MIAGRNILLLLLLLPDGLRQVQAGIARSAVLSI